MTTTGKTEPQQQKKKKEKKARIGLGVGGWSLVSGAQPEKALGGWGRGLGSAWLEGALEGGGSGPGPQ